MHKTIFFSLIIALLSASVCSAADSAAPASGKARVMMMGVFHFANPGLDKVKATQIDVMTPENQRYLDELAQRLAAFNATHVLIECDPSESAKYQAQFEQYKKDGVLPGNNENYQLGFRIAATTAAGAPRCYDERNVGWDAEQLFADLESRQPAAKQAFEQLIADITATTNERHKTLSLAELLRLSNSPAEDLLNKQLYLLTNAVGAGDNFSGADAAASWWRRNFRMYANVQHIAQPGTRVIVIGGQGHTAVMKDLLGIDGERVGVEVGSFF